MNNNRTIAKLTGWSIVLMAIVAGFVFGYANPKIYDPDNLDLLHNNFSENLSLYNLMLVGFLIIILLDITVSWTLYIFFKEDNSKLAFISFLLRIIYTIIFFLAFGYLLDNILLINLNNDVILENYQMFYLLWSLGLIVFGFHLFAVGILMKLHKQIPKILWYLTILAAVSYILVHFLKNVFPEISEFTTTLENILSLPMAIGELGLAVWLIVRGGKAKMNIPIPS